MEDIIRKQFGVKLIGKHTPKSRPLSVGKTLSCLTSAGERNNMLKSRALAALAVSGCLATLPACTTTSQVSSQGGAATTTIRSSLTTDPTSFDPSKVPALDDYRVARLGYDTLLRKDADGLVAGLAKSWEATSTQATLTLRAGATCSDGTPITPTVVANSLARLVAAATYGKLVFGGTTVGVTPDDAANTVSITVGTPYSDLLTGLTHPASAIICPAGLADEAGLAAGTVAGAFSGPYTLTKRTPGVGYEYTLRKDYNAWPEFSTPLEGKPAETIELAVTNDLGTVANQLTTGSLDIASVNYADAARFESQDGFGTTTAVIGDSFLVFNEAPTSPFSNPALRRAVAQVINREAFNQAATSGTGELEASIADSTVECVNTDESLLVPSDPETAAAVLKGVNIRLNGSLILGPNGAGNTYVQQVLTAAGANVQLTNQDNSTWASTVLSKDSTTWDLTVFITVNPMGALSPAVTRVLGDPIESGGRNMTRSDVPEAEQAYAEATAAENADAKCTALQRVQKSLLERVSFVPLSSYPVVYAERDGFAISTPAGREDLSTMRILG